MRSDQRSVNSSSIAGKLSSHFFRSGILRQFAMSCAGMIIYDSRVCREAKGLSNRVRKIRGSKCLNLADEQNARLGTRTRGKSFPAARCRIVFQEQSTPAVVG